MKLLGSLKVYITEDSDCVSGLRSKLQRNGEFRDKEFEVVLCPNSIHGAVDIEKNEQVQILAHELGHFVGHILQLPAALKDKQRTIRNKLVGLHPDALPKLPSEQEAWEVGEKILPGAKDSQAYQQSITSYAEHDDRYWKLYHDADPLTQFMVSDASLDTIK